MCLICAGPAQAGIVRVITNVDFGQGWMFLDTDSRCKVVTPAHVIRLIDGRIASTIKILDDRGRTFDNVVPEVLSDQLDVALLTVNGANDPSICGAGRLSGIGVARRTANMTGAILETTGESEIDRVPVHGRASLIDKDQSSSGSLFSVQPTIAKDVVVKGWSGSIVVDDDGPLGMVVQVNFERNEALAIRVDVIRQMIDSSRAAPRLAASQSSRALPPVILTAGTALDVNTTSSQIFGNDGRGWNVVPKDHRIVFVVAFETAIRLQRVTLSFASTANSVEGMDVATVSQAADGGGAESLKYCRADGTARMVTCSVLGSTARNVRLSLKTATNDPVALSGLTIE
jgi:hypothetical protein